ncbi:MAG TPA: Clp protease N-terminal domain-containing protein, partial [Chitinophagaceae bacterium]|nr:Clp protease N-terminal domain-containing protein [Chitinophagaceae bacterium]
MNLNNFTIKSQELFSKAQQLAFNDQHPNIETEHVLKAMLSDDDSPVDFLLKKNNINVNFVESKVDEALQKLPKVSGTEPAQTISRDLNNVMLKAGAALKTFSDEFVSVEHLLLAVLQGNDNSAKILKDAGLTEKGLIAAIKDLKKGSTISSQTSETQYNALNKYAKNLNEMARNGKLDPVIGRDEEIRRTLHILSRRSKNNPILVGEPGVGKTAIAEGLAYRIIN